MLSSPAGAHSDTCMCVFVCMRVFVRMLSSPAGAHSSLHTDARARALSLSLSLSLSVYVCVCVCVCILYSTDQPTENE